VAIPLRLNPDVGLENLHPNGQGKHDRNTKDGDKVGCTTYDPDAPVPFFQPALGSATLKKHAAAATAAAAAAATTAARGIYSAGVTNRVAGAATVAAKEVSGRAASTAPNAPVFFRTNPNAHALALAHAHGHAVHVGDAHAPRQRLSRRAPHPACIQPMPAQSNRPEELAAAAEAVLCPPVPDGVEGAGTNANTGKEGGGAHAEARYRQIIAGGRGGGEGGAGGGARAAGGASSPTSRGSRMYTPEPRLTLRELETPWRRPRPSTARPARPAGSATVAGRNARPASAAAGGSRKRGETTGRSEPALEGGVNEESEDDQRLDRGEVLEMGGSDEDEGGSSVGRRRGGRGGDVLFGDGPLLSNVYESMVAGSMTATEAATQEEGRHQLVNELRLGSRSQQRPGSARVARRGDRGGDVAARAASYPSQSPRPSSARTAEPGAHLRPFPHGGSDGDGQLSLLARSLGLPLRTRAEDEDEGKSVWGKDERVKRVSEQEAWRPRPVLALLLQPRHVRPVSASASAVGGGGGRGGGDRGWGAPPQAARVTGASTPGEGDTDTDTGRDTMETQTTTTPPMIIRAGRDSEPGGYIWRGGAPGLWQHEVTRDRGVLRRPR
jgi:hypothetical protein